MQMEAYRDQYATLFNGGRGVVDVGARVGVSCDATAVRPLAAEPR